jgi:adenylate cyclase class IV
MKIETELRYVGFDPHEIMAEAMRFAKPSIIKFRRAVFDIPGKDGWLRLRTDGTTTTLTVKISSSERATESFESEVVVQGFAEALEMLKALGFEPRSLQTNYRVLFPIRECELTIDLWPKIAPIVEIEGETEARIQEVESLFRGLQAFRTDKTVSDLYEEAGINVKYARDLDFDTTPKMIQELTTPS